MKKRIFSILLALCMVLSMMPAAFAADGDVTVYFNNSAAQWETVYAVHANSDNAIPTYVEMTKGEADVWSAEIPGTSDTIGFANALNTDAAYAGPFTVEADKTYTYDPTAAAKIDTIPELQSAIDVAVAGGMTTLPAIDNLVGVLQNETAVLDLKGCTVRLQGIISYGDLTVKNGTLIGTTSGYSVVDSFGTLTLENVNASGPRHAIRIEGGTATINGGTYAVLGTAGMTTHAVNVSGEGTRVTIKGGTFKGPKDTLGDSGSAVNVQTGSTVTIEGGNFSGGKLNTLAGAGTLTVKGGTFDQDPTDYLAEGYEVSEADGVYTAVKSWYNSGATEYVITNVKEMLDFADAVNEGNNFSGKVVKLGADIDLTGIEWVPIGGWSGSVKFAGEFDGQDYTIKNMTINTETGTRLGLFSSVLGAYIHDLAMTDVSITAKGDADRDTYIDAGAVVGLLNTYSVLENIEIDGVKINIEDQDGSLVGAAIGYGWKSQVGNVDAKNIEITINDTSFAVGGLVGYTRGHVWDTGNTEANEWLENTVIGANVLNSYYYDCDVTDLTLNIAGSGNAGGFTGGDSYNNHSNYFVNCDVEELTINCDENGSFTVGGFMGYNNGTLAALGVVGFEGCTVSGTINGSNGTYGGFVGSVGGRATDIAGAVADVDITCTGTVGGFVGRTAQYFTHQYTFTDCVTTGDVTGNVAGGFVGKTGLGGDGDNVNVEFTNCIASGIVNGISVAGGFLGEVNTELPTKNWSITEGIGNLTLIGNTASTSVSGNGTVGYLIGYFDGVANVDAKEGNKVVATLMGNTPDGSDKAAPNNHHINLSEDTNKDDIKILYPVAQIGSTLYPSLQEALNAATNGETIKLLNDITYDDSDVVCAHGGGTGFGKYDQYNPSIIYTGGTMVDGVISPSTVNAVLDLNGHTIINNAEAYTFLIMDNAKVTFTDSVGGGSITNAAEVPAIWVVGTETTVTIEDGTYITANDEGLLWSTHGGDLVIKGGEFKTTADDASLLIVRNEGNRNNPDYFVDGKATITVIGGTFYGFNPEKMMDDSTNPSTEFNAVAEGYIALEDPEGVWTVDVDYVEWVKSELLAGRNVTLDRNIVVSSKYVESIPAKSNGNGKYGIAAGSGAVFNIIEAEVSFDLNGHTITFEGHDEAFCNKAVESVFYVTDGGKLTIKDSSEKQTGAVIVNGMATGVYSVAVGSQAIIEGGTWTCSPCTECGAYNIFLYASHGGELYIKDGTFAQYPPEGEDSYLIVKHGSSTPTTASIAGVDYDATVVEVTGGTFVGMDPERAWFCDNSNGKWSETNVVAEGYVSVDNGDGSWTVKQPVTVTFKVNPSRATVVVTDSEGNTVAANEDGTYSLYAGDTYTYTVSKLGYITVTNDFTAAAGTINVTLKVYVPASSGAPTYKVNIESEDVTSSHTYASKGQTVTITVSPDAGYELTELYVIDKNGDEVELTYVGDGKYTFKMPASKVDVYATFASDECDGTYADNCPSVVYIDVNTALWYHEALDFVISEGIMNGTGNGTTFEPTANLSRAMMWTMLARLNGVDTTGGATWYEVGQKWAMTNGVSDGTNPDGNITREQMVTMLWRYVGAPTVSGDYLAGFSDANAVSSWAVDAMNWAVANGVITGNGVGLNPIGNASRAEVAQIFLNYFGK